jgi:hypothetical protein
MTCKAALAIKGEWFGCDNGPHPHDIHGNTEAGSIWSSHDEIERLPTPESAEVPDA